jgi:hypothetical protein
MTISMYQASIPAFQRTLKALSAILDKAAAHAAARKIDQAVFMAARLSPDMLPFPRQIHIAADFAKNSAARLAGVEQPKYADDEKTFDELKARIAKTLAYIETIKPGQIDGSEGRDITIPIGGKPTTFKGQAYLVEFALPNFYFHATTAYAILRHNGVEIGKRDFLGPA